MLRHVIGEEQPDQRAAGTVTTTQLTWAWWFSRTGDRTAYAGRDRAAADHLGVTGRGGASGAAARTSQAACGNISGSYGVWPINGDGMHLDSPNLRGSRVTADDDASRPDLGVLCAQGPVGRQSLACFMVRPYPCESPGGSQGKKGCGLPLAA